MKFSYWPALAVMLSGIGLAQAEDKPETKPDAQAAGLQPCFAVAADLSPVYPTRAFPSTNREIYIAFQLGEGESPGQLTGAWIAVDVGPVAPPNFKIAEATLTLKKTMRRGDFHFTLPKDLPVGKYRADVTADGKPWKSVEFTVIASAKDVEVARPEDMVPLKKGTVWNYDFVMEGGKASKITLPDVKPDADGKLRAKATYTVAGQDPLGNHIELRRNNSLVFEEWWRPTDKGLEVTQRKQGEDVLALNPPQILLPFPLKAPQSWIYSPKDNAAKQTFHIWGPVPVKRPKGDALGYIVLTLAPSELMKTTIERHYIPGYGMVRELLITAAGDDMVVRQELSLGGN